MANIIDTTYFEHGNLFIPNNKDLSVEPVGSPTVITNLDSFITRYERQLLLNALGVTLYDKLQVALLDLENSEKKWIDLVNGTNYTNINGNVKRWIGLKGFDKQSVIAFYIFTEYLRDDNETYATTGVVKNDSKNATNKSATPKFIKAYNQFIESYQGCVSVNSPVIVVNGFGTIGYDWYGSGGVDVSLLRFLTESNELNETAYPDFEFMFYYNHNSLGI